MSLACIRRYFGDSIIIKSDDTAIVGMQLRDFEMVVNIVQERRYPQAFLSYCLLREEERALASKVFEIFAETNTSAAKNVTLQEAYNALKSWWDVLPPLARRKEHHHLAAPHFGVGRRPKSFQSVRTTDTDCGRS
ncbi:MAG: hypothetical protein KJ606_06885 [Chloroflexi bacterium]|nr:hypothetical protein [Chloroflexota bacterium]